jgi:hypothetical protein
MLQVNELVEYDQYDELWCVGCKLLLAPPLSLVVIWGN